MLPLHSTKRFFIVEKVPSDYSNVLHTKQIMVLLRTVHWMVIWGTKNGSSVASLQKKKKTF